ncbi:MAG: GNAT family N-acetyltransferase [Colwellia sp.]|nr:GNAT family N-acetyltransferase [Colwellia sp.]
MIGKKDRFREFCNQEDSVPLFSNPWWLDAACGDNWDACVVENKEGVCAAMPYTIQKRKFGLTYVGQPDLTQHLGPWISPSSAKYAKRIGREKDLMDELIGQLPPFSNYSQCWHYSSSNWLPFFWNGFNQTTYYTYVLEDLCDLDGVYAGFQENVRREIRKAKNRFKLEVYCDLPLDEFLDLNEKTFNRQGKGLPYTRDYVKRIISAAQKRNQSRWFIAKDSQGRAHAGVLIVWDKNSAYYLMGGGDPDLRNSGATSLCMWEAIKFSGSITKKFDFEGSMIQSIERYFRGFGAKQKTYFGVTKTPSRLLRLGRAAKSIL